MTGGQDDAANLIDTSETGPPIGWTIIKWDADGILCESPHGHRRRYETAPMADTAELIKLRLCRELLEAAVEAWELSPQLDGFGARYALLTDVWHAKAKEAIDER